MKIIKYLLIGIVVIVAAFFTLALITPNDYSVERSIVINADKAFIMDNVRSLKNMQKWSPWAEYDPNQKVSYTGNDGEVGSVSRWEGNEDVGVGEQEVTKITDNRVETELRFIEPWESVSNAYVQVDEVEEGYKVSWGFTGTNPFPMNAMGVFMNMDEMIGKDFEKGLNKLKAMAESAPKAEASNGAYPITEIEFDTHTYLTKRGQMSTAEIGAFYGEHLPAIFEAAGKNGIEITGMPAGLYYSYDEENGTADMAAAIPVAATDKVIDGYEQVTIEPTKALKIEYYGGYENMAEAHYAMDDYMKANGLEINELVVEEYISDPGQEPDTSKWLTNIIYLIK